MSNDDNGFSGLILLVFLLLIILLTAAAIASQKHPESNTPIAVKPDYVAAKLTANPSTIDWDILHHGETATRAVTLTNTGNATTHPLHMTANAIVGTVTWDAEGATLLPKNSLIANFSLRVSDSAPQGTFNFTITIIG